MALCGFLPSPDPPAVELDPSQRAVLADESGQDLLVVGGPGTGKTTTLVEFAANYVVAGGEANSLMALTASRTAAGQLRDRLDGRVGQVATAPLARTAAAFAFEVVTAAAVRRGDPEPYLLTGAEQDADIADLLAGHAADGTGPAWPERLGADVRGLATFRTELRELMTRLVEYDAPADWLREQGVRDGRDEWIAAADFIETYRDVVGRSREHQYDSAELVSQALTLLARDEVGDEVRNLGLVLVDDLQDATPLVLELLSALSRRGVRLVAFGDPDVASNSFRGGTPDAVGRLAGAVAPRELASYALTQSHRQPEALRALSRRVTERIGTAGIVGQRTAAAAPHEGTLTRIESASSARQWSDIAQHLRECHLREGVEWSEMAVIVRGGQQVHAALRGLPTAAVPVQGVAAGTPLADESLVRHILDMITLARDASSCTDDDVESVLLGPLVGIDRLGLRRLRHALRAEEHAGGGARRGGELLREALSDPAALTTLRGSAARAAHRLAETLRQIREAFAAERSADEVLWLVWSRSRLEKPWVRAALDGRRSGTRADHDLDVVLELFTAAARFTERDPRAAADNFFHEVRQAALADDTLAPRAQSDAVTVATPPAVVGREFSVVVIASLQEGTWPDVRVRGTLLGVGELAARLRGDDPAAVDERRAIVHDELRLFALAASRARYGLVLSCVASEDEQPSPLLALAGDDAHLRSADADALPHAPMTLRGAVGHLRRTLTDPATPEPQRAEAATALARLAEHGVPGAHPSTWHGLVDATTTAPLFDRDDTVPVSPSKVEACEKSARDWFVDWVSLARSSTAMAVGTLVHAAMEEARDTSFEAVWSVIESRWPALDFDAEWDGERMRRQVRVWAGALSAYLTARRDQGVVVAASEHPFTVPFDGADLSGIIDRIEVDPDGGVRIVDLKTGAPLKKADVPDNAQLLAYQLAYAAGQLDDALGSFDSHHEAGADLLYVKQGKKKAPFSILRQEAGTREKLEEFRRRVRDVVNAMSRAEFAGPVVVTGHHLDDASPERLHRVRAVCSD